MEELELNLGDEDGSILTRRFVQFDTHCDLQNCFVTMFAKI